MKTRCLGTDRNMILRVLEHELGEKAVYRPSPEFAYVIGRCRLQRDGFIVTDEGDESVLCVLARLGLCDYRYMPQPPDNSEIVYPTEGHDGVSLMNLMGIFSARQRILNQAIDARGAFYVSEGLMTDLLAHPPETVSGFLQALYGREAEYRGLLFSREDIRFTGFRKGHPEEAHIHSQLAELIMAAARSKRWVRSFTANVRNRKYACRTWLNAIGMTGPEYEEARKTLLDRLYGRSDRKGLPGRKEQG